MFFVYNKDFCMAKKQFTEAATRGVLWRQMFLEILQNSHENTCGRGSFLIKLQAYVNIQTQIIGDKR